VKPKEKLQFPKSFLWGSATAAHQVEGDNINSDWWAWEHSQKRLDFLRAHKLKPEDFCSGIACDSYNRYEEDFSLAKHLGQNAHRLSIEWARIEPREGVFNETELDHYEKVLQSAKYHGLTTFVTLHHFTSPLWFIKKGGFAEKFSVGSFTKYADMVSKRLSEYVDFWLTINEPEMYCTHSYLFGIFPPQIKSLRTTLKVVNNLAKSHNTASEVIKFNTRKPVSMSYHLSDIQPHGFLGNIAASLVHYVSNEFILNKTIAACDFIGLNYYNHHHVGLFGKRHHSHSGHEHNDLGWGIHPEGLERVLLNLKKFNKPIYITENGLADAKDVKREKFIKDHLYYVHKAISKGADIRGYLHWSLLDNFEWEKGFRPRFGLVEIDREDFLRRKVRGSALVYAEICRKNLVEY